jgi:hypothetical protein
MNQRSRNPPGAFDPNCEVERTHGARLSRAAARWKEESVADFWPVPACSTRCGSGDPRSNCNATRVLGLKLWLAAAALLALVIGGAPACAQQITTLIQFTNVWKYDQSGVDLGRAWRTNDYDDSTWSSGRGLLGFDDTAVAIANYGSHAPTSTSLDIAPGLITYYFRTTFEFTGELRGLSMVATNLVDDGCMIYLNGLPAGGVRAVAGYNASTLFGGPAVEGQLDVVTLTNLAALRQGANLLAVEVHQSGTTSADIMWGMKLMAVQQTPLSITNQPQDRIAVVGDPIAFVVGVSGGPAFYRWEKGGIVQPSTSNTLTISSAQLANAGDYRVIITNSVSAATSRVATLTVFPDRDGPRLLAAIGNNTPAGETFTFGSNTINVLFDEAVNNVVTGTGVRNTNNYTVTRLGTTDTVRILNILYSTSLGALLNVDPTDPDWAPGGDYVLTVSNVADTRGNVIAPGSQATVAWGLTTNLIASGAVWDFHASAFFEPEVFEEDWFACDYSPSLWWALGQGLFFGGVIAAEPCLPLGTLQTQTGYQPEPAVYRTTFQWPADWPSSGTLRIATAYDDGLVLYLDGKEIYRNNAGAVDTPVGLATRAPSSSSTCVTNLSVSVFNLDSGFHCLAAAVLQADTPTSADSVFALRMDGLAYLSPALPEPPPPVLALTPLDTNSARLSWTGGGYALESATNLSLHAASYPVGPWQQVTNMSNPYTNRLDENQRFFRLKK